MKRTEILATLVLALSLMVCQSELAGAAPIGTAFTYQGRLIDANDAADGLYDFEFKLFDDPCTGIQQGGPIDVNDLDVIDGYFTVELDFGSVFNGDARWLEIDVRPGDSNDANDFVSLVPRRELTPAPYAIYASASAPDYDWQVVSNDMYSIPLGNVGIGTTSPDEKLVIGTPLGSGWAIPAVTVGGTNGGVFQCGNPTYKISMEHGNIWKRARIVSSDNEGFGKGDIEFRCANIGIGTTSPAYKLDVTGDLRVTGFIYGNADRLDGLHSSAFATSGHGHDAAYVNVTGDTMTGALNMITTGTSINVDANPTGTTVYGVKVKADQSAANNYAVYGVYSDVDSAASTAATYGTYSNATGNNYAYGVYGYGDSATRSPYGLYGYSIIPSSASTSAYSSYGLYVTGTTYGTGNAYGAYDQAHHYGTSGTTYGTYSYARGSDTGHAYGTYSTGWKSSADTGGTAYGGYFTGDNDDTGNSYGIYTRAIGTGGGTNYGIYATASGGTTNYAGYFVGTTYISGNVGIGTVDPENELHVGQGGNPIIKIDGALNTSGEGPRLRWTETYGTDYGIEAFLDSAKDALIFRNIQADAVTLDNILVIKRLTGKVGIGTDTPAEKLTVRGGNLLIERADGTDVVEIGEGLDYAEGFDVSAHDKIDAGSVLIIDADNPGKLALSNKPYDTKVAGIVAGANSMGSGVRLGAGEFDHDVALAGRVYCNVDATETCVEAGDLLTTSATPGYAMKSTDYARAQGAILGKAMESLEKGQKGQILVLVTLQ